MRHMDKCGPSIVKLVGNNWTLCLDTLSNKYRSTLKYTDIECRFNVQLEWPMSNLGNYKLTKFLATGFSS